ncbi:DNA repair protein rad2, partial [Mortierella alpina]
MGVKGLWELLHPVARPIKLETLANKHLAIDASIWLHQFLRGMRDKEGQVLGNAHVLGFFRRICKLLYYNIKPIFVFDGGTPALKRMTILERRKRKRHDENMVKRTAEKLLAAQLRLRALEQRKAARKKKEQEKQDKLDNVVHDSAENPKYLDDLTNGVAEPTNEDLELETAAVIAGSRAKKIKDRYVLPPMEVDFDTLAKIRSHDERFGYQPDDDVSTFLDEFKKESGVANIDSDVFKALPSEMQYEILHDIRLRSRVTSYERVQEMVRLSDTPMDFSKLQVQGVIRRNIVTHKLLSVNQTVSKAETATKPGRIASQRNRQYILVRNEDGGWVLGGKKPTSGVTADKPVQLDSDDEGGDTKEIKEEDEEGWESDDDDDIEFEEVKIPQVQHEPTLASGEPLRSPRRSSVRPRTIAPKPTPKSPAKPAVKKDDDSLLINLPEAYMDENESIEKVMAKFAQIEDEASWGQSSKRSLSQTQGVNGDDADGTNEKNGLQLVQPDTRPEAIKVEDGARQHLGKADLKPGSDIHWPETISDSEELDSLSTLNSDNTTDFTDLEDLVEDEETGEVISRKEYNKKRRSSRVADSSSDAPEQPPSGRALSITEETRLGQEEFHEYWTGYTPDSFKIKNPDMHEFMLQEAIFDWDTDRLSSEVHSATRKLEKSSVNDTVGAESLQFWRSFLNSVIQWRQHQQQQIQQEEDNVHEISLTKTSEARQFAAGIDLPADNSTLGTHLPPTTISVERKSRLSQYVLADDDAEDEEDETLTGIQLSLTTPSSIVHTQDQAAAVSTHREATLLAELDTKEEPVAALPQPPVLDFSSSILKRRLPVEEQLKEATLMEPLEPSRAIEISEALLGNDEGVGLDSAINASGSDSGLGSLLSSPALEGDATLEPSLVDEEMETDLEAGKALDDDEATVMKEQADILAELTADIQTAEAAEEGDEEEEYEDEAHEADLENEEQDFTNLFPDMANLPGAILLPKETTSPPPPTQTLKTIAETSAPALSAEEVEALKKQDAKRMFEESKKLEGEIKVLQDQHRKHQRDADDLTESMVAETKMLLKLFGIPYIVAPMEAEAQCADLQLRGVVDGILTEDSDVFLFGGMRIFKNMFKEEKYVECYLMSDIERDLGVGRDRLVSLAYLLGSDYTTGVKGVGLVTAMEILRLFPKLENFATWWRGEQLKHEKAESKEDEGDGLGISDKGISSDDELGLESIDEVALEKLAKQCRKIHLSSTFPDPHVADAYKRPMVDDDPTEFQWGIPDLDGLRDFLRKSLSWDRGEVDRVLLPIIRQMSSAQHQTQTTLDAFFDKSVGTDFHYQPPVRKTLHKSARLRKVVSGLTGQKDSLPGTDDQGDAQAAVKKSKKTPVKRKSAAAGKKNKADEEGAQQEGGADEEVGSDTVEEVLVKTKKQRTSSAAGKKTRTAQTIVPAAVTAAKRQLQSKDVEAKLAVRNRNRAAAAAVAAAATAADKEAEDGHATVISKGVKRSNGSKAGSDTHSSGSSGEDDEQEDFAPSHWDILAQRQRQQQEYIQQHLQQSQSSPKKGGVSGAASSLSAMVSASNAAR